MIMNLTNTKIVVAVLFGLSRILFGLLPIKLCRFLKIPIGDDEKKSKQQKLGCGLAMFQAFGGGVIFATCFLHMMPEVYESTLELKKYGYIQSHYPFSQLVVSIGFFFVYFVEEIAHYFVSSLPEDDICKRKGMGEKQEAIQAIEVKPRTPMNKVAPEVLDLEQDEDGNDDEGVDLPSPSPSANENEKNEDQGREDLESQTIVENDEINEKQLEEACQDTDNVEEMSQVVELDKLMKQPKLTQQQIIRGILIILALSLHGFFEGLAIGLQTSVGSIWYLFIAISIHSATILFVISLELLLANAKLRIIIVHVLILAIVCPIGVLLGTVVTLGTNTESRAKTVAVVILEGLSAGTITYITFFEVLNREKARRIFRLRRSISILLGFCLMACLECFEIYY